jgi:hypothetical protein
MLAMMAALLGAKAAVAFEEERSELGARVRWSADSTVSVRLASPVPGLPDGGAGALRRALATWSSVDCTSFRFVATEDAAAPVEVRVVTAGWPHGPTIAAHTDVDSEPYTGVVRHVLIELDGMRAWTERDPVPADGLDLESVLLHELGHAAGLAHSRYNASVMKAGTRPGSAPRRALHEDDRAGICALYPLQPLVTPAAVQAAPPRPRGALLAASLTVAALLALVLAPRIRRRLARPRGAPGLNR